MAKWVSEALAAVESEGVRCVAWETSGGGHIRLTITHRGVARKLFTSRTPSDHRTLANLRRDVRRIMHEIEQVATHPADPQESTSA